MIADDSLNTCLKSTLDFEIIVKNRDDQIVGSSSRSKQIRFDKYPNFVDTVHPLYLINFGRIFQVDSHILVFNLETANHV